MTHHVSNSDFRKQDLADKRHSDIVGLLIVHIIATNMLYPCLHEMLREKYVEKIQLFWKFPRIHWRLPSVSNGAKKQRFGVKHSRLFETIDRQTECFRYFSLKQKSQNHVTTQCEDRTHSTKIFFSLRQKYQILSLLFKPTIVSPFTISPSYVSCFTLHFSSTNLSKIDVSILSYFYKLIFSIEIKFSK